MTPEQARRVVEALAPEARVERIESGREATTVVTDTLSYVVRDIEAALNFERSPGYELLDVTDDSYVDPAGAVDGFAFLPDGSMFHLNDPAQLRAFWRAADGAVTPLELCSLLAWYQSDARAHETLVAGEDDLDRMLRPEARDALPLAVPPDIVYIDGTLMMRFTTLFLTADEVTGIYHTNLNVWQARTDEAGDLEWFYTPVARNHPNPFYAP